MSKTEKKYEVPIPCSGMARIDDIKNTKINSYQLFFVIGYLVLLMMFCFYTYIIIKTKSTPIILISMVILFTYSAYLVHFTNRVMRLCDDSLRKWKKTINLTNKILDHHKEVINDIYNIRARLNRRIQKKKH